MHIGHSQTHTTSPIHRLESYGEKSLSTIELLAILIQDKSLGCHPLSQAAQLIEHFGDLRQLQAAGIHELCEYSGINRSSAIELKAAFELGVRSQLAVLDIRPHIESPADAAQLVMAEMGLLEKEHLKIIILDSRNRVQKVETVCIGSLNAAYVRIGEVFRPAIRENGAALILAHNHPTGDVTASKADIQLTRNLVKSGELIDIPILDHLIIGHGRFRSMREQGLGFDS